MIVGKVMMKVLKNELTVYFDVDDTLVMWNQPITERTLNIICPYSGRAEQVVPHNVHIKVLEHHKARGYHVVVWSAGGWEWAKAVVEALGIQDHVSEVRSKPLKYFDDLPAAEILGTRVYIPFKEEA